MRPADETPDCVAFVSYDLFPHVVSHKAVRLPDGNVWIPHLHCSYKRQACIDVMPLDEGLKVADQLHELKYLHSEQTKALWSTFMRAAAVVLPELPGWRKAIGRKPY